MFLYYLKYLLQVCGRAKPTIYCKPGIVLFVHLDYTFARFFFLSLGCLGLSRTLKLSQKLSSVQKAAR